MAFHYKVLARALHSNCFALVQGGKLKIKNETSIKGRGIRMKGMQSILCVMLVFLATESKAVEKTWICDSEASVGFDEQRGYEPVRYKAHQSYRIRTAIGRNGLSLESDRANHIFETGNDAAMQAASIQMTGYDFVGLCRDIEFTKQIICDGPMPFASRFDLSLETGLFTLLAGGFEDGGISFVEVGKCRRVD